MTGLFFALRREAAPLLRSLRGLKRLRLPFPAWDGSTPGGVRVRACLTGVGPDATQRMLTQHSPASYAQLIVAGFAGALDPTLEVGSVCEVGTVLTPEGASPPLPGDRRLLSMPRMILRVQERQELRAQYQADLVDMESATLVTWARSQQLPVRVVRAVSDDATHELSDRLQRLIVAGQPSIPRVVLNLFRAPGLLPQLLRLARNTDLAARRLSQSLLQQLDAGE